MKVILSIKPEFADKIFEGSKKYEFRKAIFKNSNIKTIIVYASSPVQKIIGEFEIDHIISDEPASLWNQTAQQSGITKEFFFQYFKERSNGFAIKIKKTKKYRVPKCIREDFHLFPPQSFLYIA